MEKAKQDRQQKVVQAEGEAKAAYMISSSNVVPVVSQDEIHCEVSFVQSVVLHCV